MFSPWLDLAFLWARVPLVQVSRHVVFITDAFRRGWVAVWGSWMGYQLQWHTNCLSDDSATSPVLVSTVASGQARVNLHGNHTLTLSQLSSGSSVAQLSSSSAPFTFWASSIMWHALMTAHISGRIETPSPRGPADLESIRGITGRARRSFTP